MDTDQQKKELSEALSGAEKVPIGVGGERKLRDDGRDVCQHCPGDQAQEELREAYAALWSLIRDRDYCAVATVMDGAACDTDFDNGRVVAPCGSIHWRQCPKACIKDIWEEGEVPDDTYSYCKASLTGNTVDAEIYIGEGYLSRWEAYKKWQTGALNRRLAIPELGEGFKMPTVMRWPFEKIGFFNQKSVFYRIHETFYQMPKEMGERAAGIRADSVAFIRGLAKDRKEYQNYFIITMLC